MTDEARVEPPGQLPAIVVAAHAAAIAADEAGYIDPTSGLFVLTSSFLANRGFCCERGCRHCPYRTD